jgi:cell division GTPase FtsZ
MKLCVLGLGQAGGKLLDALLEYDANTGSHIVQGHVAVNTAKADLLGLEYVPEDRRLLIGQDRVKGHGVGADNQLGSEVANADLSEIVGALDSVPVHEVDAFLLIAGLGGGTGSGAMPVVARELQRLYTEPVYGLGILPSQDEGGIYTLNAARSFQTCVGEVDNLIVFDNGAWKRTDTNISDWYTEINGEMIRRLGVLFGAGEIEHGDDVAESVVDASEIINTLSGGGVSTIGYATDRLSEEDLGKKGLLARFSSKTDHNQNDGSRTNRITSLLRKAALGQLTLPCDIDATERALVIVAGPQSHISRKGIEHGRRWLEDTTGTMEVRGGDYPLADSPYIAGLVLLSGVTSVPRIKELQRVAIETSQNMDDIRASSDGNLASLVETDEDELDSLF